MTIIEQTRFHKTYNEKESREQSEQQHHKYNKLVCAQYDKIYDSFVY